MSHPEPGFYIVGMKSYGRAPTFLLLTGYEQVRSVAAALAGDWAAARRVELELPETGVCSGPVAAGGGVAASCCGSAEPVLPLTTLRDSTPVAAVSSCCAPDVQSTCCAPEAKADCCGTTALGASTAEASLTLMTETGGSCGCQ